MPTRPAYPAFDATATSAALAAGRQVRVGILPTHHFPDGGAGRVRNIGDPAVIGPEFVEVEVTIGGVKDVIPFAPGDLTPIKRGQAAPVAQAQAPARRTATRTRRPARATTDAVGAGTGATVSAAASSAVEPPRDAAPGSASAPGNEPAEPAGNAAASEAPAAATPRPRPRGRPARTTPAAVRITVGTVEPEHEQWQAEVVVDGKVVGRPVTVSPAQIWSLVGQLGVPAAERAVGQALSAHRERARLRAEQLAKELAAAEAELARYPSPS